MKNRLSLMLILVTFLSFAQNKFEQGYYIDNSGKKTECLIKNYDWKNNPKNIETKSSENENLVIKQIDEISEFAITGKSKFIRVTVKIDESSQNSNTLSYSPAPKFIDKTILLKVLVEGKSNLYYYESENYDRFFYSVNDKIEQLVFKKYYNSEGNILTNNQYKQQLLVNFSCNNDQKSIVALNYNNNDLIDYFIKTNNCISGVTETKAISEKRKFEKNFKVNLLLNSVSQNISVPYLDINSKSQNSNSMSFGFETEITLPYNNKNWSVVFDPSYTIYKKTNIINFVESNTNIKYNYKNNILLFRFPLGIRRYFTLNANNKIYTNLGLSINIINNRVEKYLEENGGYTSLNFVAGLGYQYKKYNVELKLNNKTFTYTNPYSGKEISLNQITLKLGYKLF